MAVKQRKDGRWVVYYRARDGSGKTVYEYFGRGQDAYAAARQRDEELGLRRYSPKKPKTAGTPFGLLAQAYYENKQFNENSLKHLYIRLHANILPFFGNRIAEDLRFADMDRYVAHRIRQGVKYTTIAREITDVKAILTWCATRRPPLIPANPIRDYPKPKTDDAVLWPPTREELQGILANAAPHLQRAIKLAYFAGMRPGPVELLSLRWRSVSWSERIIQIMSAHKGGPVRRAVDIHPAFLPMLERWCQEDQIFFDADIIHDRPIVHYRGKAIKRIHKSWKAALQDAGITRRIRPYDIRHSFATRALSDGADIKTISEIMGSSPRTIMATYHHVSNPLRRRTISRMEDLEDG